MKDRLEILIQAHELYWQGKDSPLTDAEYDEEIEWLRKTHPHHYLLKKIGGSSLSGEQIRHHVPMLSLDKAYTFEELRKFIKNTARNNEEEYVVQAKFDGLAGKFEEGVLSTRGNGHIGENITRKLKDTIWVHNGQNLSLQGIILHQPVFGEILCTKEQFAKYGAGYKTPRNFVIGMVNRKESMPKGFKLMFVEYDSSPSIKFRADAFDESLWNKIQSFFHLYEDYAKDGLVFKLTDRQYGESLGYTSHHPKSAIAYKFDGENKESTLTNVIWQSGKNCLTPVAVINPIELGGVTVTRATLHNYETVQNMNLHIGDILKVKRAGDVIPYVESCRPGKERSGKVDIAECPYCGQEVMRRNKEIVCSDGACPGKCFAKLLAGIKEAEIDYLGQGNLTKVVRSFDIRHVWELFDLTIDDYIKADIGKTISRKIYQSVQEHRRMVPEQFFAILNIEGLGRTTWKTILCHHSFEKICSVPSKADFVKSKYGDKTIRKIIQGLTMCKCEISEMLKRVQVIDEQKSDAEKGSICFTGKMPQKRSCYEQLARENGFAPVNTVTKDLTILVCDTILSGSSKLKAAKKLGVKILTLDEWLKGLMK